MTKRETVLYIKNIKWRCDHRSWNRNLSNLVRMSPKRRFSGFQQDSNPWPLRLHSSVGRALQHERRGHWFESRWSPEKLLFELIRYCLNCDFNCDGQIFISFVFLQFASFHCTLKITDNDAIWEWKYFFLIAWWLTQGCLPRNFSIARQQRTPELRTFYITVDVQTSNRTT